MCSIGIFGEFFAQDTKWMTVGGNTRCLEAHVKLKSLYVAACDATNANQRWQWGNLNRTALENYDAEGPKAF